MAYLTSTIVLLTQLFLWEAAAFEQAQQTLVHRCPEVKSWEKKLVLHHIAVGQGDSTFIRTPSGTTILVDGGLPANGRDDVIPTLKKCYRLRSIDYVVLTHFDHDHLGGLLHILEAFEVTKAIYDPGDGVASSEPSQAFTKYQQIASASHKRKIPPLGDEAIASGDGVNVDLVAVNGKVWKGKSVDILDEKGIPTDANAVSIAMTFRYGKFDYFIGGDLTGGGRSTADVESPVADVVGDVDVLHANHHGSATSNNEYFLNKLLPEAIVISVGDGGLNKAIYHLPDAEVLERLDRFSFVEKIFMTARGETLNASQLRSKVTNLNGDIILVADPKQYWVQNDRFETDGR